MNRGVNERHTSTGTLVHFNHTRSRMFRVEPCDSWLLLPATSTRVFPFPSLRSDILILDNNRLQVHSVSSRTFLPPGMTMQLARVIGTVVSTVKSDLLEARKLLVIQPLDAKLEETGKPLGKGRAFVDPLQAGAATNPHETIRDHQN